MASPQESHTSQRRQHTEGGFADCLTGPQQGAHMGMTVFSLTAACCADEQTMESEVVQKAKKEEQHDPPPNNLQYWNTDNLGIISCMRVFCLYW